MSALEEFDVKLSLKLNSQLCACVGMPNTVVQDQAMLGAFGMSIVHDVLVTHRLFESRVASSQVAAAGMIKGHPHVLEGHLLFVHAHRLALHLIACFWLQ